MKDLGGSEGPLHGFSRPPHLPGPPTRQQQRQEGQPGGGGGRPHPRRGVLGSPAGLTAPPARLPPLRDQRSAAAAAPPLLRRPIIRGRLASSTSAEWPAASWRGGKEEGRRGGGAWGGGGGERKGRGGERERETPSEAGIAAAAPPTLIIPGQQEEGAGEGDGLWSLSPGAGGCAAPAISGLADLGNGVEGSMRGFARGCDLGTRAQANAMSDRSGIEPRADITSHRIQGGDPSGLGGGVKGGRDRDKSSGFLGGGHAGPPGLASGWTLEWIGAGTWLGLPASVL